MKKIILFILTTIWIINFSSATTLSFTDINIQTFLNNFSEIHFSGPWNNFVWAILWFPNTSLNSGVEINLSWESKKCRQQLRWIYYNTARWDKILPLDQQTLNSLIVINSSYNNLDIEWWLFTSCENSPFGIYWQINFLQSWANSSLIAWTRIDYPNNRVFNQFGETFSYFNNSKPLWYLVDSIWWIWFIGWQLSWQNCLACLLNWDCTDANCTTCSGQSINELFTTSWNTIITNSGCNFSLSWNTNPTSSGNLKMWINIQWTIGLSSSIWILQNQTIQGSNSNKNNIISSFNITTATILNEIRKKSEQYCRWKESYEEDTLSSNTDNIICINKINYSSWNKLTIDLSNENTYKNKTIFAKNTNIILEKSMQNNSSPINIFVDNWNIFIKNNTNTGSLIGFNWKWYIAESWFVGKWVYINWNLIANWLLLWTDWTNTTPIQNRIYIHWKTYTLNSLVSPTTWKINQIKNIFFSEEFNNYINLNNLSEWFCNPTSWIWTDGTNCENDPLATSAITIIDQKTEKSIFFE